jgi:hypothetical protein
MAQYFTNHYVAPLGDDNDNSNRSNKSHEKNGKDRQRSRSRDSFSSGSSAGSLLKVTKSVRLGPIAVLATQHVVNCFQEISLLATDKYSTEEGRNFVENDTLMVNRSNVVDGMIVIAPDSLQQVEDAIVSPDEACDRDYVAFRIVGRCGDTTRLKLIGKLFIGALHTEFGVSDCLTIKTPERFLRPMGFILEAVDSVLGAVAVAEGPKQTLKGKSVDCVIKTGQMITADGDIKYTQDNKNVVTRQKLLQGLWRLTHKDNEIFFAPDGSLDPKMFHFNLGRALEQDSYVVMRNARQLRNVAHLSLMKDMKVFTSFITVAFEENGLSLDYFNPLMGEPATVPDHLGKLQIAVALVSCQYALVGVFHEEFANCFYKVLEGIQVNIVVYETLSNDYMWDTMNRSWFDWGRCIVTLEKHPAFPDISLRTPAGCAQLLGDLMHADLARISGVNEGNLDRIFRLKKELKATYSLRNISMPAASLLHDANMVPASACSFYIAERLKVVQKSTGLVYKCVPKNGRCLKDHVDLKMYTRNQVETFIGNYAIKQLRGGMMAKSAAFSDFAP